ncbi:MAG: hypothetical protein IPL49_03300 [Saprospirales bacterium]|nr:hypothetical protein [Saprospirales bacterium]
MKIFKWFLGIAIFWLSGTALSAQVFPPELLCLRGDTIVWNLPTNTCGSFNSYDIWYSSSFNGPYSLLNSVTNPGQTSFVHPNPGNDLFYYYMTGNYNCPGEPVLSSDTLDNLLARACGDTKRVGERKQRGAYLDAQSFARGIRLYDLSAYRHQCGHH